MMIDPPKIKINPLKNHLSAHETPWDCSDFLC